MSWFCAVLWWSNLLMLTPRGGAVTGAVRLPVGSPPTVVGLGIGVHGVTRLVERWQLPGLYSVHLYSYNGELRVGDLVYPIRPGGVSVVPPGSLMEFRYEGRSEHLYAHLALGSDAADGDVREIPLMQNARDAAHPIAERLRGAIALSDPLRRSAELWAVLCWITELGAGRGEEASAHPAVAEAVAYIDANLAERLTVAKIAAAVTFSPSHLDRLFLASKGCTVGAFVRERRMSTARHLLVETTRPIGSIAAAVGIPDLHAFNKACRRAFGAPPRAVRG